MTDEERDDLRRIQDEVIRQNPGLDPKTRIDPDGPSLEQIKTVLYPEWKRTMKDLINEA